MKSRPDLHQVLECVAADEARTVPLVVATVLRAEGSTPLEAGAKALIGTGGLVAGTIGGGAVEAEALRRARVMLQREPAVDSMPGETARGRRPSLETQPADVFDFALQGPGGLDPGPICGGLMRVLLQPLTSTDRQVYRAAHAALLQRNHGVLETRVSNNGGTTAQSRWIEAHDARATTSRPANPRATHVLESDESSELFLEPVNPRPLLLIVGAGHVGQALAAQAAPAGFDLAVIDDRRELLEPEGFPDRTRLLCGDIPRAVRGFPMDEDTWVVLVTRGHLADASALAESLRRPAVYVGMIGSRRKIQLMRRHFLDRGLATAEEFDRVHAPIGLDIGAETAPEIAISILAQIIALRRGATTPGGARNWSNVK